jgi:hypothetical protein
MDLPCSTFPESAGREPDPSFALDLSTALFFIWIDVEESGGEPDPSPLNSVAMAFFPPNLRNAWYSRWANNADPK